MSTNRASLLPNLQVNGSTAYRQIEGRQMFRIDVISIMQELQKQLKYRKRGLKSNGATILPQYLGIYARPLGIHIHSGHCIIQAEAWLERLREANYTFFWAWYVPCLTRFAIFPTLKLQFREYARRHAHARSIELSYFFDEPESLQ